jgi:TolA-binding protein
MKKITIASSLLSIALLWAAAPSFATQDGSQPGSMQEFLVRVRLKLESLMPKRTQTVTTAVSGVRGREASASDVYWKGEARQVTDQEMAKFREAMADLEEGRTERAKAAMQQFVNEYPHSELSIEAMTALSYISAR